MRTLKNDFDVSFIGGQKPITKKEEEKAISRFFEASKLRREKIKAAKPIAPPARKRASGV